MGNKFNGLALSVISIVQTFTLATLIITAVVMALWTGLAAFGVWPWLGLNLTLGDTAIAGAGLYVQIGLTILAIGLCVFLPSNARVLRLEHSHRKFSINLEDIAKAYQISHQSDRKGIFALSEEFDAVRERMLHLRKHPDLGNLEPEILEIAAQMSFQSRDLATIYSEDKVERAFQFLTHRQEEADKMEDRLAAARQTCDELRRWLQDVEAEERIAKQQIERLESDLFELLPSLGFELDGEPNVVKLDTLPAKKASKAEAESTPKRLL